jgi:hypothetical protein
MLIIVLLVLILLAILFPRGLRFIFWAILIGVCVVYELSGSGKLENVDVVTDAYVVGFFVAVLYLFVKVWKWLWNLRAPNGGA